MAAIDIEKMVSKQIAQAQGHKLTNWSGGPQDTLIASCKLCSAEFVINKRGRERCATNIHEPCKPNDKLTDSRPR